jgi:hypothetical protein
MESETTTSTADKGKIDFFTALPSLFIDEVCFI